MVARGRQTVAGKAAAMVSEGQGRRQLAQVVRLCVRRSGGKKKMGRRKENRERKEKK